MSTQTSVPNHVEQAQQQAIRLEWISVFAMGSVVVVMYFASGSSQAMKAAWVEDMLGLIPPITYLVAMRFARRPADANFKWGYARALSLAFLCAATALLIFGGYLLIDGIRGLLAPDSGELGTVSLGDREVWSGWLMLAALLYSAIPPILLGRKKLELGRTLHQKALHTEATMNRDDWLTAAAAAVGIGGVALGFAATDALAAIVISVQVLKDGFEHMREALSALADGRPTTVDLDGIDELVAQVERIADDWHWVKRSEVRLRELGHFIGGEILIVPTDEKGLLTRLGEARQQLRKLDWRIDEVVIVPVSSLPGEK